MGALAVITWNQEIVSFMPQPCGLGAITTATHCPYRVGVSGKNQCGRGERRFVL